MFVDVAIFTDGEKPTASVLKRREKTRAYMEKHGPAFSIIWPGCVDDFKEGQTRAVTFVEYRTGTAVRKSGRAFSDASIQMLKDLTRLDTDTVDGVTAINEMFKTHGVKKMLTLIGRDKLFTGEPVNMLELRGKFLRISEADPDKMGEHVTILENMFDAFACNGEVV